MKLIVGLGNPGPRYRHTRHNIGFMVVERVAIGLGSVFSREKFDAKLAEGAWQSEKVMLLKPMIFMNRSGQAVAQASKNSIQSLADLLVVADDVNLPLGKVRLRASGSAGGHNGLKSIIENIGSQEFARLRIGVGENTEQGDLSDHVLGSFRPEDKTQVEEMVDRGAEAVLCFITHGIEQTMSRFN